MEPSSEQELRQLLDEGKITEQEYQELLEAIHKQPQPEINMNNMEDKFPFKSIPWQIWVIISILAFAGFGDFLIMFNQPQAMLWFLYKVLTIIGFIKGWKWVFVLFLIFGSVHVVFFALTNPAISLINLALVILAWTARRHFFGQKQKTQYSGA